jgi:hypothetical protein
LDLGAPSLHLFLHWYIVSPLDQIHLVVPPASHLTAATDRADPLAAFLLVGHLLALDAILFV